MPVCHFLYLKVIFSDKILSVNMTFKYDSLVGQKTDYAIISIH
jgi:hypothetical protein